MDYKKWLPEIKACPVFDDLSDDEIARELEQLAPHITHFAKDEPVFKRGEPVPGFGVFLNTVPPKIPVRRKEKWRYPGPWTPGWIFAELPGFFDKKIAFSVNAPQECYIMFIDADRFTGYCGENSRAHQLLIRNQFGVYARKCIALKRARRFFKLCDITENVALFLWDQVSAAEIRAADADASFTPERDDEELAEMMMIGEDAIAQGYKNLCEKKIILRDANGKVTVLDKTALEAAAGPRAHEKPGH